MESIKKYNIDMKYIKKINEYKKSLDTYEVFVNGFDFEISGEFEGGDSPVYYHDDGSGYPGSSDRFFIHDIYGFDEDGSKIPLTEDELYNDFDKTTIEDLEEAVVDKISDKDSWDYREDYYDI